MSRWAVSATSSPASRARVTLRNWMALPFTLGSIKSYASVQKTAASACRPEESRVALPSSPDQAVSGRRFGLGMTRNGGGAGGAERPPTGGARKPPPRHPPPPPRGGGGGPPRPRRPPARQPPPSTRGVAD